MADQKVTVMVLKVDLQCPCCYKKVKKILCKFPQIRDQVYDVKANTVTITVVCCNPEKIRDKLCCKGCKVIKSIEIKEPEKKPKEKPPPPPAKEKPPPPPAKEKPPPPPPEKEKPPPPPPPEKEKPPPPPPKKDKPPPPPPEKEKPPPPPHCGPGIYPVDVCPPYYPVPVRTCCGPCSEGYGGGPCYYGYGVPPPPQPCYDGYCGCGCGQRWGCRVSRCDYYLSDDNPRGCAIV